MAKRASVVCLADNKCGPGTPSVGSQDNPLGERSRPERGGTGLRTSPLWRFWPGLSLTVHLDPITRSVSISCLVLVEAMLGKDLSALTEPESLSSDVSGIILMAPAYWGKFTEKKGCEVSFHTDRHRGLFICIYSSKWGTWRVQGCNKCPSRDEQMFFWLQDASVSIGSQMWYQALPKYFARIALNTSFPVLPGFLGNRGCVFTLVYQAVKVCWMGGGGGSSR